MTFELFQLVEKPNQENPLAMPRGFYLTEQQAWDHVYHPLLKPRYEVNKVLASNVVFAIKEWIGDFNAYVIAEIAATPEAALEYLETIKRETHPCDEPPYIEVRELLQ